MMLDDDIQHEAARWFAAQRRGPMALEDRQAFDAWRAHPVHQAALNHMHEVWGELARIGEAEIPRRRVRRRGRRAAMAAVWMLGLAGVLSAGAAFRFDRASAETGIGEQRSEALPDGSIVALNVLTEARYDLGARARVVHLREGEAAFVVHKDVDRPFLVRTGGYEVRAVGTAFNVRNRDRQLVVAVKEGVVEVTPLKGGERPVRLRAGQRLQVRDLGRPGGASSNVSAVSPTAVDEWRQRVLAYEDAPVDEVVRDLNRFYERPLAVDAALAKRRVTLRLVVEDRGETASRLATLLGATLSDAGRQDRLRPVD